MKHDVETEGLGVPRRRSGDEPDMGTPGGGQRRGSAALPGPPQEQPGPGHAAHAGDLDP